MITEIHPSSPIEQEAKYFVTLLHSSPNNASFNEEKKLEIKDKWNSLESNKLTSEILNFVKNFDSFSSIFQISIRPFMKPIATWFSVVHSTNVIFFSCSNV